MQNTLKRPPKGQRGPAQPLKKVKPTHHQCATPGCLTETPKSFLICKPCWRSLPQGLRLEIAIALEGMKLRNLDAFEAHRLKIAEAFLFITSRKTIKNEPSELDSPDGDDAARI